MGMGVGLAYNNEVYEFIEVIEYGVMLSLPSLVFLIGRSFRLLLFLLDSFKLFF